MGEDPAVGRVRGAGVGMPIRCPDSHAVSTVLGDALGSGMRAAAWLFDYAVPLAAVSAYRLIPDARRGELFGGPSTSLETVRQMRASHGSGWAAIRAAASNHPARLP